MNALKSMMKITARVRRGGTELEIPAEEVVVGDVILLAAGDEVPADGRIIAATALQIDESALTGESVPAQKEASTLSGSALAPGDQVNMAFMNTPVTHGSGVMIVTATAAESEMGKISGMLSATEAEQSPLTKELNTLTLWIVAAAGLTMVVMFILGRARNEAWDVLFVAAVSLAIAAIPEALPTVTQVILSLGSVELAKRNALVKELPAVETLGFTSAINSDKTGTLTLNQMTAVEVLDPTDRYTITGSGYSLEGHVEHVAGKTDTIEDAIVPFLIANDATLVEGEVVGDPTEGALLVLGHKAGVDIEGTREALPRLATLPFDPTYKLMATFHQVNVDGRSVVRCFVKGAAPAVMERAATALSAGAVIPWDEDLAARAQANVERMAGAGQRVMAAAQRDLDLVGFDPEGDLLAHVQELQMTALVGMVDPPRAESKAAVAEAQAAHIRVRMITGDDVTTGAAIAEQVGIGGEAILGADFAAMSETERLARIDDIGVVGPGRARAQGAARRDPQGEGGGRGHDRRRRQRRPGHQGGRHRHRHGQRHRGGQERRADDPLRRQLRHHRLCGRAGPQDLRQPHQVHPLRARPPCRLRPHVPGSLALQHRRGSALQPGPGAVDPLLRERRLRFRPRVRP